MKKETLPINSENLYTKDCIRTVSGKYVNVFQPKPETLLIEDIAHALSMLPRFGGHLPVFYSVAEHCIKVSRVVNDENKLTALMHDAAEAYLLDLPSPIKKQFPFYNFIEHGLNVTLAEKFGFTYPFPSAVHNADRVMLHYEWDNIMLTNQMPVLTQAEAKEEFLKIFYMFKL